MVGTVGREEVVRKGGRRVNTVKKCVQTEALPLSGRRGDPAQCCQRPGGEAEVNTKFEIFKVDTKLFLKCRQLSASLWAMVLLVKHVS
jgi:hypothetical protein